MTGYRLSELAQNYIDSYWDRNADLDGVESAERFIWRVHDLFRLLGSQPVLGRMSRVIPNSVRKFPLDDYISYYTVQEKRVQVARAFFTASGGTRRRIGDRLRLRHFSRRR